MPTRSKRLHDAPFAVSSRHFLTVGQWKFDVFVDGQVTNQIEALKDEADLLIPNARPLSKIKVLDCLSVQRIAPGSRGIQKPNDR